MVLLAAAWALGGCGASARDEVKAKVEQFANATAGKDYKTICDQVLASNLVDHLTASGITCNQAMRIFVDSVQNPSLSIGRITVDGPKASVITLTSARGQEGSLDAVQLVQTDNGWRISSLAAPLLPPARKRGAGTGASAGRPGK